MRSIAGRHGVVPLTTFDTSSCRAHCAALVADFDPTRWIPPMKLRRMDAAGTYAVALARQALDDAGVPYGETPDDDVGIVLGTYTAGGQPTEEFLRGLFALGPDGRAGPHLQRDRRQHRGEPRRPRDEAARTERDHQPERGVGTRRDRAGVGHPAPRARASADRGWGGRRVSVCSTACTIGSGRCRMRMAALKGVARSTPRETASCSGKAGSCSSWRTRWTRGRGARRFTAACSRLPPVARPSG